MQFCECLHQHAADELFLHNILWTDEACLTREGVFKAHISHLWARDNPHAIRERGYQFRFSVSVWAGIVGDIVMGPYLLPDRLTAQRYRDFLGAGLKMCLLLCGRSCGFSTTEIQRTVGKMSGIG
jgi:hypothetical protein